MSFPYTRLRRTRMHDWSRRLTQETRLSVSDLIWPTFVMEGNNVSQPIDSMPGVERYSIDCLIKKVKQAESLGIPMVALFPVTPTELKTDDGNEAVNPDNLMCRAVKAIKDAGINIGMMCDVALDPYTTHGHDGVFVGDEIDNDASVDVLVQSALNLANAGYDVIAPSDMMDGRVGAIRETLEGEGLVNTLIMSYAAKYASNFYGPFRDAVDSKSNLAKKDKKSYQMDFANSDEALREVELDIEEGADMIMVKPGMPYLDIVHRVKETFNMPTFAYQVSGEYAMIKAAAEKGWLDEQAAMFEALMAFKRAGCDGILTYAALDIAERL
tara:strand:- start:3004 stop:3984 length:981 start_codon:yes stop_codon:yes gene_type:complete